MNLFELCGQYPEIMDLWTHAERLLHELPVVPRPQVEAFIDARLAIWNTPLDKDNVRREIITALYGAAGS